MKVYNQEFDDALVREYQEHVVNGTTYKIVSSKRFRPVIKAVKALAEDYLSNYTNLPDERVKKIIKFAVVALVTHDIWEIEDVKTKIPKCQYCDSGKLVVPDASGRNRGKFTRHCGRKECSIKYTADRTKEVVKEKYGVENISSLESMKKLKSKKLKDAYARKGKEINEKRKKTVRKKYGVDNVSQLNEVKAKKGQTFTEHYGVDNIFKRTDLMKQFWKESIGVENPIFDRDINKRRVEHMSESVITALPNGYKATINGIEYVFAAEHEEKIFRNCLKIMDEIDYHPDVAVNTKVFHVAENSYHTYIADIAFGDDGMLEIKGMYENTKPEVKHLNMLNSLGSGVLKAISAALYNNLNFGLYIDKPDIKGLLWIGKDKKSVQFAYLSTSNPNTVDVYAKEFAQDVFNNLKAFKINGSMNIILKAFILALKNQTDLGTELVKMVKK